MVMVNNTADISKVTTDISKLKTYWFQRNKKFKEWYEVLVLIDLLSSKGMETYVSNEPQTFYNMAHYLLTNGDLTHTTPIENESALELDRRAKINRGCEYMWEVLDRGRRLAGSQTFVDDLSFFLLVLGWFSVISEFNNKTGLLNSQIWNPFDVYPSFSNNRLTSCVHSYKLSEEEAAQKAEEKGWRYIPRGTPMGEVILDDYFYQDSNDLYNMILIDSKDVTGWLTRPDMQLLVSPVGGFPDKGSLSPNKKDWKKLSGRGIFEVNEAVTNSFNKWKSMVSQILRDTAQPITQEFSSTPQATPEQLRERGALFHYAPGEAGLQRVPPPIIPGEVQVHLGEQRRELQKGSFNDVVYGMVESSGRQAGYSLSLLASSSANQILYPYMDGKHFVISECDRFWLSKLKSSGKTFQIKGKFIEKLSPEDVPQDIDIKVRSDIATPRDWLERGTIGNMLDKHLDISTIITEIYKLDDPQAIKRRKSLDRMLEHPMSQMVEMIAGYYSHAEYLEMVGDRRQAALFRRAAQSLETQLGAPQPGQGRPEDMSRITSEREAGSPGEITRVAPTVAPPESRGVAPGQLREAIGRGSVRATTGV